jgi:hypothetical protein
LDGASEMALSPPAQTGRRGRPFRALFLLVLLAALAVALPSDRRAPIDSPPEPAARPAPTPTASPLLPSSDLFYRVPERIRSHCVPVASGGNAAYETLDCAEGLTRALYTRYADVADVEAYFEAIVATFSLPLREGACKFGVPSHGEWHYTHSPTRPEGRMACFVVAPENIPVIVVTQPEQRIVAAVISNPSVGWEGNFDAWAKHVPNPPPDRQRPRQATPPVP